jgi:hypothetical protein
MQEQMSMANQFSGSLDERFEEKFTPEPNSGCWLWTASADNGGYGTIAAYGKVQKAHRVSWIMNKGKIPAGLNVLHRCDNPACVNPDHLFLGTQAENVADMVTKGRQRTVPRFGTDNPQAALDEETVWAIRAMLKMKLFSQIEVSRSYGVSPMTISRIANNQSWTHVQEQLS